MTSFSDGGVNFHLNYQRKVDYHLVILKANDDDSNLEWFSNYADGEQKDTYSVPQQDKEKYLPSITGIKRGAQVVKSWKAVCKGQQNANKLRFSQYKVGNFCDVPQWSFGSMAYCSQVAKE